jgi:hypothetical protein
MEGSHEMKFSEGADYDASKEIFSFGGFINLALIKVTSDLHSIFICSNGHLYLGEESQTLLSFSHPLSDDSCF